MKQNKRMNANTKSFFIFFFFFLNLCLWNRIIKRNFSFSKFGIFTFPHFKIFFVWNFNQLFPLLFFFEQLKFFFFFFFSNSKKKKLFVYDVVYWYFFFFFNIIKTCWPNWIRRLTTDQEIQGSSPWQVFFFCKFIFV